MSDREFNFRTNAKEESVIEDKLRFRDLSWVLRILILFNSVVAFFFLVILIFILIDIIRKYGFL